MKTKYSSLLIMLFIAATAHTQNTFPSTDSVGIGTFTPDASSILEVKSTTQGILIPRMTKAKRDAIVSPVEGLMIYQTNSTPGFYYYNGSAWTAVTSNGVNKSLSNLTSPTAINVSLLPVANNTQDLGSSTNGWKNIYAASNFYLSNISFIANKNDNVLVGQNAGNSITSGVRNTAIGNTSMYEATVATDNTALGYHSLYSNKSAYYNVAIGSFSLYHSNAPYNHAIGYEALYENTTGTNNIAMGFKALANNTTGNANIAIGQNALFSNTTSSGSVAVGDSALYFNTTGSGNTALGSDALKTNANGGGNTAIGSQSLYSNISGVNNIATGFGALYNNTTGSSNTATGANTMVRNTTGISNTATGIAAMFFNTTGNYNVANGGRALISNTIGSYNTAVGYSSLQANTEGTNNIALGYQALMKNEKGFDNIAIGINALQNNFNAGGNIAIGYEALKSNFDGLYNIAIGNDALSSDSTELYCVAIGDSTLAGHNTTNIAVISTAVGNRALAHNTSGYYNSAFGAHSLYNNLDGSDNSAFGQEALFYNTNGEGNTAIGFDALESNTTGSNNVAIGPYALARNITGNVNIGILGNVSSSNLSNAITIGGIATASDQVRIGNVSTTSIGGYVAWTKLSDKRIKKNIKSNVPGLAFINLLQPITYNLDLDAADKIIQCLAIKDKDGKTIQPSQDEISARKAQQQVVCTGFIAQDVEISAKKIGYDFDGVDPAKNSKDLYGLRYSEFVVPLVKAVQELSKMNNEKDAKIDTQQKEIDDLKTMMQLLQQQFNSCNPCSAAASQQSSIITLNSSASLAQNIPNPFNHTTTINYILPQTYSSAKIIITGKNGSTIKELNISGSSKGSLKVDASTLTSGAYQYSLYVNGSRIDTKQMVLAK